MSRSLVAALLSTLIIPGCDHDSDRTSTGAPSYCLISWSGALATDSSVFTVRACWNGRCTSDMTIQATTSDAGAPTPNADAGCTPAPTNTRRATFGLPSRAEGGFQKRLFEAGTR